MGVEFYNRSRQEALPTIAQYLEMLIPGEMSFMSLSKSMKKTHEVFAYHTHSG